MAWLRLIRWQNLLIIFLTQLLVWACVILPLHPDVNDTMILNTGNFFCLALSTVLIAAAGYMINDYFDLKIDLLNRPEKVVLGKSIPRKTAILWHTLLNIIALAFAGYVAAQAHHYEWLLLQAGCTVLLWFYSTTFKRMYMIGNIVVGLLTALTIVILLVYEPLMLHNMSFFSRTHTSGAMTDLPVWMLATYAYFAFVLTWMREIVKDMEDYQGDEAEGCITMPIKRGLQYSTVFTQVLSLLAIASLTAAAVLLFRYDHKLLSGYTALFIVAPIGWWAWQLGKGSTPAHYHKASRSLKIIMLSGICTLLIYHFQQII